MVLPKITFRYSWIYDRNLYRLAFDKENDDIRYFERRKKESLEAIAKLESRLGPVLSEYLIRFSNVLGVDWEDHDITVYVLPDLHKPMKVLGFSDPMTVVLRGWDDHQSVQLSLDTIFYTTIHELSHIIQRPLHKTNYAINLMKVANNESITVRNHILTFALLKKVLGERDFYKLTQRHHSDRAYKKSLDLVERLGEDNIIEEAREYLSGKKV